MFRIRVPSLAENVEQATIGRWLVNVGDEVEAGQEVAEMLTEKAEFTLESEEAGRVTCLLAPEKSVLPVGTVICMLDADEEAIAEARRENDAIVSRLMTTETVRQKPGRSVAANMPAAGIRATPAARRLARESGVRLDEVAGRLGIEGIVREEDVRDFLKNIGT